MHYDIIQWYIRFPVTCTTDLDCETLNPWLSDEIWFFEYVDQVISYLI